MDKDYSVLMSVYAKEKPAYLRAALLSMTGQTLKPLEIVLVCDGPLPESLEAVLLETEFSDVLKIVRLKQNSGLGKALARGLSECSCEWIARMDSDDISAFDRCEKQMRYLEEHPEIDVISGTIAEFCGEMQNETDVKEHISAWKKVPATQEEITSYIKMRNPINHPCVMFRRSKVLEAGGYQPCPLFEDYDLWVRMFRLGDQFANLPDTLLYMRVNNMHKRRGGLPYIKFIVHFWTGMYRCGMINFAQYSFALISRIVICILPNGIRKIIYDRKLRTCKSNNRKATEKY